MKSGGYLSSQRLTVSTFGVKELNFCVRNGNRWILFAIVTAMVIYTAFPQNTYIFSFNLFGRLTTTQQTLRKTFLISFFQNLKLVKIIDFIILKRFSFKLSCISLLRSSQTTYQYRSANTLLHLHLRPINLVVYKESSGIPYLEASFTLRCFQRLSQPHSATLQCRWRDNRCTVGAFIPVLSY